MTDINDIKRRMEGAVKSLQGEFSGLRTGRASASMLDPIQVDAYGSPMPLSQLATVSAPEPRMLIVQVWDKSMVKAVEKAIRESDLNLNPSGDGQSIRVPVPELSEERRRELTKVAHKYAENGKVAVRHVRRDGMDELKKQEKDGKISEDDHRRLSDEIQKATDSFIKKIDELLAAKEQDIMSV